MIYERLKCYRDYTPVDMDKIDFSHTYEVDGEKIAYGIIIDRILKGFEMSLKDESYRLDDDKVEECKKCWKLLGEIYWSLWW